VTHLKHSLTCPNKLRQITLDRRQFTLEVINTVNAGEVGQRIKLKLNGPNQAQE
jgi:hypothetical protein